MGMRANFARIDADGVMKMTSVQWSTMIDKTLSAMLKQFDTEAEMEQAMSNVFTEITDNFEHISCADFKDEMFEYSRFQESFDIVPENIVLTFGDDCKVDVKPDYEVFSAADKSSLKDYFNKFSNFHFEDGISVLYNENNPDVVLFGFEKCGKKVLKIVSLEDLRDDEVFTEYRGKI